MLNYIRGILIHKNPMKAVVETASGIAFELMIPISTYEVLPEMGKDCMIYTHLQVSQDDIRLYGFATQAECELYQQLNRIAGIGPKIALSIISTLPIPTFVRAIEKGEEALLTKIPGIGSKSAQRLIIELRGKLLHLLEYEVSEGKVLEEDVITEVEIALQALGFNPKEVRKELSLLGDESSQMPTEQLIKEIIKRIYQRRR
ncbi:MAG TPA: Holliday junction branch migration protein RuvA [Candidatus Syntrophosphaera sp.]|nr:Holliday junction branch migration protein RuvA [Candidatus Syntrophosphaera sp.]HOD59525.1 Holliday junction branch migration protein RuvA [Candidatus Syntrophosphaera sp.]HQM79338.1 Holliday junction branch migration protein RuvA [Candidatus Syntrophosphaera sp.]HRD00884.1 Holliday junction branch migration protein RuvA [Candidatus Syntrophosphaera thermopropionivorans]